LFPDRRARDILNYKANGSSAAARFNRFGKVENDSPRGEDQAQLLSREEMTNLDHARTIS